LKKKLIFKEGKEVLVMVVLTVQGVPDNFSKEKLKKYWEDLRLALYGTSEFSSFSKVTVFFPRDILQTGLGEEIIISVSGFLYDRVARDVMDRYAKELGKITKVFFPDSLVEVSIHFSSRYLVWTSNPEE